LLKAADPERFSEVAPHAGAWIETPSDDPVPQGRGVAPHAGAWIETRQHNLELHDSKRRAPRGRVD